jgi:hypothetical protein
MRDPGEEDGGEVLWDDWEQKMAQDTGEFLGVLLVWILVCMKDLSAKGVWEIWGTLVRGMVYSGAFVGAHCGGYV